MSKETKHTPADMLEELQLSLEILEEKMDNIYDIVKSKPQKDYSYSNDDEYDDDDDEDEDDDMNDNSFGWDDWYDEPKGE